MRTKTARVALLVIALVAALGVSGAVGWVVLERRARSRRPLAVLSRGEAGGVRGIAFTPDGARVAWGGDGRQIVLQDTTTGETISVFDCPDAVTSLALSPDGRRLAYGDAGGGIFVVDVTLQKLLWTKDTRLIDYLVDSPLRADHVDDTGGEVFIDTTDRHAVDRPQVWSLQFSPSGDLVIAEDSSGNLGLLRATDGKIERGLATPVGRVFATAVSPRGDLFAGGSNGKVALFSLQERKLTSTIQAHEKSVGSLACSPRGEYFATASDDGTVKLWRPGSSEPVSTITGFSGKACLAFSPEGDRLACGAWKWVRVVSVPDGARIEERAVEEGNVTRVAFSPVGDKLAAGMRDGHVNIWWAPF